VGSQTGWGQQGLGDGARSSLSEYYALTSGRIIEVDWPCVCDADQQNACMRWWLQELTSPPPQLATHGHTHSAATRTQTGPTMGAHPDARGVRLLHQLLVVGHGAVSGRVLQQQAADVLAHRERPLVLRPTPMIGQVRCFGAASQLPRSCCRLRLRISTWRSNSSGREVQLARFCGASGQMAMGEHGASTRVRTRQQREALDADGPRPDGHWSLWEQWVVTRSLLCQVTGQAPKQRKQQRLTTAQVLVGPQLLAISDQNSQPVDETHCQRSNSPAPQLPGPTPLHESESPQ
jgi:hypothetical protein